MAEKAKMIKHEISAISKKSIAEEMDISIGDFLLSINGEVVQDFLDYRFKIEEPALLVEIEKKNGEVWELDIEKEPGEDLGMNFKQSLMSDTKRCCNHCVFCFIDQQPTGLRDTLYVKDDDPRHSFLLGNYVTLTNLSPAEIKRLAGYHISPLRVSVHAADLDMREKMMGTSRARNLFDALDVFCQAGIELHFQIVLCKGLNDGPVLDDTIKKLRAYQPQAKSLSIVPAGLTRHREGLYPLEAFTTEEAQQVILQVKQHKDKHSSKHNGKHKKADDFIYLSDEWYLMGEVPLPRYAAYGDFPQLDNGVGVLRLFEREFTQKLAQEVAKKEVKKGTKRTISGRMSPTAYPVVYISIVTGVAAAGFMKKRARQFMDAFPWVVVTIHAIQNDFFGPSVTVSGLLTGEDILKGLDGLASKGHWPHVLFLPANGFRAGVKEKVMLDGMTLAAFETKIAAQWRQERQKNGQQEKWVGDKNVTLAIGDPHGGKFFSQLLGAVKRVQGESIYER